jgi:hypothetical protein
MSRMIHLISSIFCFFISLYLFFCEALLLIISYLLFLNQPCTVLKFSLNICVSCRQSRSRFSCEMNFLIFSTLDSNFPAIFTQIIFIFVYASSPLFFFIVMILSLIFLGGNHFQHVKRLID